MEIWHIWIIVALAFVIIELFTQSFGVICFSFGCIFSAIAAAIGWNFKIQLAVFAVVTLLSFLLVRPLLKKLFLRKATIETNINSLTGKTGKVVEKIDPKENTGRITIDGDNWKVITENGETVEVGETVSVTAVNNNILTVKK